MQKEIEREIIKLIKNLKPEIKKRAVFLFNDYKREKDKLILADTELFSNPPVITFYLRSIEKIFINELKNYLSHEIIHTFTKNEQDAYSKQNKMDFFK